MDGDYMRYYAVRNGNKTGIFTDWEECKKSVYSYPNAEFKSFSTKEDALAYLTGESKVTNDGNPFGYVDGSYNAVNQEYSFGAIIVIDGVMYRFKKRFEKDEDSKSRNVAGEIKGAAFLINYAIKEGIKELDLYYDYNGIEKFYTKEWKASTNIALKYAAYAETAKQKIKVNFIKVKSHSNVEYNDLVDSLAKEALGIK